MASAVVGALRVILSADTAEFKSGLNEATKLTGDFSGKLTGLSGQIQGFGKVFGSMFTVGAITTAAKQIIDYASNIQDLADQTGLSTKSIQEMGHAAQLTGTNLEAFTNAAFRLGTNLAGGSNSVQAAVEKLGLSYAQLRNLSPDEQFDAIAAALGRVENAQDRNKLAVDLFGKAAKEILPAIAQGYDDIAKSAIIAGDEQIKALDTAGDAVSSFWEGVKGGSVQALGTVLVAVKNFDELDRSVQKNTITTWDWASALEAAGLKAQSFPKVLGQMATAAGNLPKPLEAINLSVAEQEERMKALSVWHGKTATSTRSVGEAQEEVDENIQRLTASFERQIEAFRRTNTIQASVHESFRLMKVDFTETIPILQNLTTNGFEPFKATIEQNKTAIISWSKTWSDTLSQLPNVIISAIQGGGSAIGAAGALIGKSLMTRFQETFGPAIEAALPFGIGKAITALLPTIGTLFGPIAKAIGGFFRNIFGGPDAEELAGRQKVAAFEDELHSLLTQTQKNEAGNEDWKMTVIAIRDAYIAAGRTEAEALAAAERLWQSSKRGAAETAAAIAAIQSVLDQATNATDELGQAMDRTFRDRQVNVDINERSHGYEGDDQGNAIGTMGRYGSWFKNFGEGFDTSLHGIEAVVRQDQAVPFAMDVMSGLSSGAQTAAAPSSQPTPVYVQLENKIMLDGQEMKRWNSRKLVESIENNEGGLRSLLRDGLGVTT